MTDIIRCREVQTKAEIIFNESNIFEIYDSKHGVAVLAGESAGPSTNHTKIQPICTISVRSMENSSSGI